MSSEFPTNSNLSQRMTFVFTIAVGHSVVDYKQRLCACRCLKKSLRYANDQSQDDAKHPCYLDRVTDY